MATLYINGPLVWIGVLLLTYWNFFRYYSNALAAIFWIFLAIVIKHAVARFFDAVEWVSGVNSHTTDYAVQTPYILDLDLSFLQSMINLLAITFFAGSKAVAAWWEPLIAIIFISCWTSRVGKHVTAWEHRTHCQFRVFTVFSGTLALCFAALLWSFYATTPRPTDEANEVLYYSLILWSLIQLIKLLQLLIFVFLHVFYAWTSQGRVGGGFDPMEKVGLVVCSAKTAVSCVAAFMYCSDEATVFMKLVVMYCLCFLINELSTLYRFDSVLLPFPEVQMAGYCVICQDAIDMQERARKMQCGHVFHSRCLHRWLMRVEQCPMCRQPTQIAPATNIYGGVEAAAGASNVQRPRLQNTQNIALQTTFELGCNLRPHAFQGSLRPLARLGIPAIDSTRHCCDVDGAEATDMPRHTVPELQQLRAEEEEDCIEENEGSMIMSVGNGASHDLLSVISEEPDEFADNPIASLNSKLLVRKRRHTVSEVSEAFLASFMDSSVNLEATDNSVQDKKTRLEIFRMNRRSFTE